MISASLQVSSVSAGGRSGISVLTLEGDVYHLSPEEDFQVGEPILSQVSMLSVSKNHFLAVAKVFAFVHPASTGVSLQKACSATIVKKMVTIENVCDLLLILIRRPVIDLKYLLDFAYSFFRINKLIIRRVAPEGFRALQSSRQFKDVMASDTVIMSEALESVRLKFGQDWVESDIGSLGIVEEPKKTTIPKKAAPPKPSVVTPVVPIITPSPAMTPVIAMTVHSEDPCLPSPFHLDDFVPLSEATSSRPACGASTSFVQKKVKNWTRKKLDLSPPQAPWIQCESVPSSPPLNEVMANELVECVPLKCRESRWFPADRVKPTSLPDLMRQQQEETEIQEAIRLVEEFERSQLKENENKRRFKQYNNQRRHGKRS